MNIVERSGTTATSANAGTAQQLVNDGYVGEVLSTTNLGRSVPGLAMVSPMSCR